MVTSSEGIRPEPKFSKERIMNKKEIKKCMAGLEAHGVQLDEFTTGGKHHRFFVQKDGVKFTVTASTTNRSGEGVNWFLNNLRKQMRILGLEFDCRRNAA